MLTKRIIPCLDVNEGRVVKGVRFLRLRDAGDPVAIAKVYDEQGADELVFLDITASYEKRRIMIHVVERTAQKVFMPLTVGGGVRTLQDIRDLLNAGADKVSINTAAVNNPSFVRKASERFGSQCIVVAIDAKKDSHPPLKRRDRQGVWQVYTHGGRVPADKDVVGWAKEVEASGAGEILLTSMDRDGTKSGYDLELTRCVAQAVKIPVIASGGAGRLADFYDAFTKGKADAALAAGLFHFGELQIGQVKTYLKEKGIAIR